MSVMRTLLTPPSASSRMRIHLPNPRSASAGMRCDWTLRGLREAHVRRSWAIAEPVTSKVTLSAPPFVTLGVTSCGGHGGGRNVTLGRSGQKGRHDVHRRHDPVPAGRSSVFPPLRSSQVFEDAGRRSCVAEFGGDMSSRPSVASQSPQKLAMGTRITTITTASGRAPSSVVMRRSSTLTMPGGGAQATLHGSGTPACRTARPRP